MKKLYKATVSGVVMFVCDAEQEDLKTAATESFFEEISGGLDDLEVVVAEVAYKHQVNKEWLNKIPWNLSDDDDEITVEKFLDEEYKQYLRLKEKFEG